MLIETICVKFRTQIIDRNIQIYDIDTTHLLRYQGHQGYCSVAMTFPFYIILFGLYCFIFWQNK